MPYPFYYLRGAVGEEGLLTEQQTAISSLLQGNYSTHNLEKLKGHHNVYSLRLSGEARLLFTIISLEGTSYLLMLDYLPTHDYHKSRFLKSGVLQNYIEKVSVSEVPPIFEAISETELAPIQNLIQSDDALEQVARPAVMDYFRNLFIKLAPEQEKVLTINTPAGTRGGAGSGKTVTALSVISAYVDSHPLEGGWTPQRIVYVSSSPKLVQDMRNAWSLLPQSVDNPHEVMFQSIEALIRDEPRFANVTLLGPNEFAEWHKIYLSQKKKHSKATGTVFPFEEFADANKIYQEMRTCSGYLKKDYECLGERQSLFQIDTRSFIFEAYGEYLKHLSTSHSHVTDPSFHQFSDTQKASYDLVLVDEAQDMGLGQLVALASLAKEQQFMVWMDDNQRLQDELSVFSRACELLRIPLNHRITLHGFYRCPLQIMALADQVRLFRDFLAGGTLGKQEEEHGAVQLAPSRAGRAYLVDNTTLLSLHWLKSAAEGTGFAIITQKEHIELCKDLFKTPLVFTPETIKGLEYRVILTWKLYPDRVFVDIKKRVDELNSKGAKPHPKHQALRGAQHTQFNPHLNAIYTAYTRATEMLLICEEGSLAAPLLDTLSPLADKGPPQSSAVEETESTPESWRAEVHKQLDVGNNLMAEAIFNARISRNPSDFKALLKSRTPEILKSSSLSSSSSPLNTSSEPPLPSTTSYSSPASARTIPPIIRKKKKKKASPNKAEPSSSSSPPPPPSTQPIDLNSKEQRFAQALHDDFNETRFKTVAITLNTDLSLLLSARVKDNNTLLDFIFQDQERTNAFTRCIANNLYLVMKIPFASLLSKDKKNQILRGLFQCQKNFFRLEMISLYDGISPLCIAAEMGLIDAVRALIAAHADINKASPDGDTPLFIAAENGHIDVVSALIAAHAIVNQACSDGATPLYIAAENGHIDVVNALIKAKANVNQEAPSDGATPPLCIAAENGHIDVVNALIGAKANVNQARTSDGATPLCIAAENGHTNVVIALIGAKANVNQACSNGATPLYFAALKDHIDIVNALIAANADINKACYEGSTPLCIAAERGHIRVVNALLAKDADVDLGPKGYTPVVIAILNQHKEVFNALRAKGPFHPLEHQPNTSFFSSSSQNFFSNDSDSNSSVNKSRTEEQSEMIQRQCCSITNSS